MKRIKAREAQARAEAEERRKKAEEEKLAKAANAEERAKLEKEAKEGGLCHLIRSPSRSDPPEDAPH